MIVTGGIKGKGRHSQTLYDSVRKDDTDNDMAHRSPLHAHSLSHIYTRTWYATQAPPTTPSSHTHTYTHMQPTANPRRSRSRNATKSAGITHMDMGKNTGATYYAILSDMYSSNLGLIMGVQEAVTGLGMYTYVHSYVDICQEPSEWVAWRVRVSTYMDAYLSRLRPLHTPSIACSTNQQQRTPQNENAKRQGTWSARCSAPLSSH